MYAIFKKYILILCTIIFCLQIVSCQNKNPASVQELTTINIWTGDSHSKLVFNKLVEDFNNTIGKEKNIKVEYTVRTGSQQNIEAAIASNQAPEMFSIWDIEKYSDSGDIIALNDIPGGDELLKQYDKEVLETYTWQGKVYRLPFYVNTEGLIYNKDMFRKYGIVDENGEPTPPKTYAQVREYAKRMTNKDEHEYGIILPVKWGDFVKVNVVSASQVNCGISGWDAVNGRFDFSGIKPILQMYLDIKNDKSCYPGTDSMENDPARAQFSQGKIGMKFSASFDVGVFNVQFPAKCDWGVAELPVADENAKYKQRLSYGGNIVINKKRVDAVGADKILEVYKWYHSKEVLSQMYKEGVAIPQDTEIIDNTVLENPPKGWKEFADLVKISAFSLKDPSPDLEGGRKFTNVIIEDVWTGKTSIDSAIEDINQRYNKGISKKFDGNPKYNINDYMVKEWNIRR